jgi:phage replication initiation protein
VQECGDQSHPAPDVGCSKIISLPDEEAPRLVIRGESFYGNAHSDEPKSENYSVLFNQKNSPVAHEAKIHGEPLAALTDYLNCTFPFAGSPESIIELKSHFGLFLGEEFNSFQQRRGGLHGYQRSFDIGKTGGLFAYGGQRGTALVSLPGSTCALIADWGQCYHLFHDVLKARITRWDGAVDVFDGKPSVDDAVKFYQSGLFNAGGNKPKCSQQGNWLEPDGTGRTLYIGKRKNGKLLRVYEKGKQLGDPDSLWVRWELELHNRDRVIPWDVLLEPGNYLAASYTCMDWVSEIQERIRTLQNTATISYDHLCHHAQRGYGKLINLMLQVEGSPDKVIERLKKPGVPARLVMGERSPSPLIIKTDNESNDV